MRGRMLLRTTQPRQPAPIGASWKPPGQWARRQCLTGGTRCAIGILPPVCTSPAAQSHRKAASQRKTGPLRVRFKFVGAGADYHLPEGNTAGVSIAIWEDRQPTASSNKFNIAAAMSPNN